MDFTGLEGMDGLDDINNMDAFFNFDAPAFGTEGNGFGADEPFGGGDATFFDAYLNMGGDVAADDNEEGKAFSG